jgi:hypothetical protein
MNAVHSLQGLFMLATILIGIKSTSLNPSREKMAIVGYTIASFLVTFNVIFDFFNLRRLAVNGFIIAEYYFFAILICKIVGIKKLLFPILLLSTIFTFVSATTINIDWINNIRNDLIVIENVSLTILCLYYYKNLLVQSTEKTIDYTKNFSFWIITGACIYFCLTTPYYILLQIINQKTRSAFYLINATCNIAMFCFFIKGYLCTVKN